jgi:hypothetical protein
MNEVRKQNWLTTRSDFEFQAEGLFFTAEVKTRAGASSSVDWLASGLDPEGNLRCFLTTRVGCAAMNENDALNQINLMLPAVIALATLARSSNGLSQASRNEIVVQDLERTIAVHLTNHLGNLDSKDSPITVASRTALQTAFCKSVGLTKYVDFLARFETVPITTIRRRLDNARTLGLIPKRGESDD